MIGAEGWEQTTPFLFLSEDWFGAPKGFEEHPHRGMQTVTVVLEGALEHRDHTGAHGILRAGDVQWMTAGHGVLHSEMPHGNETAHTLQLWLNLPRKMKMIPARYQDQRLADVPVRKVQGGEVRVYAGRSGEVSHRHGSDYPMSLLDIRLRAGASLGQEIATRDRGFVYVLEGRATVGSKKVEKGDVAWFEPGGGDELSIAAESDFRGLLFAGEPIHEPAVAYGPFVMNTKHEIQQAFLDYQAGKLVAQS
ncbi:MAG TPA: pirin family protein [Burkholderiales bacterium]|nr:pirin family protein [Burkholderiales bacterium]